MPWPLANRVALVTGATSCLGMAISNRLASRGCSVIGMGRSEARLGRLAALPGNVQAIKCDLLEFDKSEAIVRQAAKEKGRIDLLVNCAGVTMNKLLLRTTIPDFDEMFRLNTTAALHMSKCVVRHGGMLARKDGCVISIGSVVGTSGNAGQVAYAASKSALVGATRSMARELGAHNIRFNLVCPGLVANTSMANELSEEQRQAWSANCAMKRLATCDEVADAVEMLAFCSFVTGQVVRVDGYME